MADEEPIDATAGGAGELPTVDDAATVPLPRECLVCYVWRMLDEHGCNATLRWARHWRAGRAPRATALERRLARLGACCDCELFLNVWVPVGPPPSSANPLGLAIPMAHDGCAGVRRGSAQPCRRWVRRRER